MGGGTGMGFGSKLQQLRQCSGLSQAELAGVSGVSTGAIRNYEQGLRLPTLLNAQLLALALNVSLDVFPLCINKQTKE